MYPHDSTHIMQSGAVSLQRSAIASTTARNSVGSPSTTGLMSRNCLLMGFGNPTVFRVALRTRSARNLSCAMVMRLGPITGFGIVVDWENKASSARLRKRRCRFLGPPTGKSLRAAFALWVSRPIACFGSLRPSAPVGPDPWGHASAHRPGYTKYLLLAWHFRPRGH